MGVQIRPSRKAGKKIDVLRGKKVVARIGARGYKDYPHYLKGENQGLYPKGTAAAKRRNFKKRFEHLRHRKGSPAWYADRLLW